jgi:hypothetical protein
VRDSTSQNVRKNDKVEEDAPHAADLAILIGYKLDV